MYSFTRSYSLLLNNVCKLIRFLSCVQVPYKIYQPEVYSEEFSETEGFGLAVDVDLFTASVLFSLFFLDAIRECN